jgi:hypothetical protein
MLKNVTDNVEKCWFVKCIYNIKCIAVFKCLIRRFKVMDIEQRSLTGKIYIEM